MGINVIDWAKATLAAEAIEHEETKQIVTQVLPAVQATVEAILASANKDIDAQRVALVADLEKFRNETVSQIQGLVSEIAGQLASIKLGFVK